MKVKIFKAGSYEVLKESTTDDKGRFAIEVSPGKYDLTANQTVNSNSQVQTVTFSTPISVTLPVANPPGSADEIVVYKYNESTGVWDEIGGAYNAADGTITFDRTTFSKYTPMKRPKAPKVDTAFITVGGSECSVTITDRVTGVIDLRNPPAATTISAGRLTVSKRAVLTLTAQTNLTPFINFHSAITQTLNSGSNPLNVITYLGAVYPSGGLTLARIRRLFGGGDTLTFVGTLTDANNIANVSDVSLTIRLP